MNFCTTLLFWVHFFFLFNFNFLSLSIPVSSENNITFYGDADLRNNSITLTQEYNCSVSNSSSSASPSSSCYSGVGRALYQYPIRFLDPKTKKIVSFSCQFSFSIIPSPPCPFGDGVAFLITSSAESFSLYNGYMGLPAGRTLNPQDSFIAVEFDTNHDLSLFDINNNHIGIDVNNTVVSFTSVDAASEGIDLRSGRQIKAWIEYTDSTKLIQVWVSYLKLKPPNPILKSKIDLSEYLKEYMHVGFSASNGQGSAFHIVDHWQFRTNYNSQLLMNKTEEEFCFMCFDENESPGNNGEPIYVHEKKSKIREMNIVLSGLSALVLFLTIFFLIKNKRGTGKRNKEDLIVRIQEVPTRFSIAEIKLATMGFHPERVIGEGSSATIYKGFLPFSGTVAIKRFNKAEIDWFCNPFISEFATIMSCLRHNNLVQFQGWCCEGAELVLVYEYLPSGSLDSILHNNTSSSIVLSWNQRLNIVLGVASALSYLHQEFERPIIHRDVKTCNIMLDEEFNAKLGDFGLAEVYGHSSMTREGTITVGTMGYFAPEYLYSGVPSVKTDVYSFGVVLLEVATGKRPVENDGTVLVDWVWRFLDQGKLIEVADPKLEWQFNEVEMEKMLMVGLCCVHPNHESRPTVNEAAKILIGLAPLPLLPARKPKLGFHCILPEDSEGRKSNLGGDHSSGTDEVSWMSPSSNVSWD